MTTNTEKKQLDFIPAEDRINASLLENHIHFS